MRVKCFAQDLQKTVTPASDTERTLQRCSSRPSALTFWTVFIVWTTIYQYSDLRNPGSLIFRFGDKLSYISRQQMLSELP